MLVYVKNYILEHMTDKIFLFGDPGPPPCATSPKVEMLEAPPPG